MTGYMDAEGTRIEMDGAMNEDGSCTYTTHWKAAGKGSEDYIATLHPDNTGTYKSEKARAKCNAKLMAHSSLGL